RRAAAGCAIAALFSVTLKYWVVMCPFPFSESDVIMPAPERVAAGIFRKVRNLHCHKKRSTCGRPTAKKEPSRTRRGEDEERPHRAVRSSKRRSSSPA